MAKKKKGKIKTKKAKKKKAAVSAIVARKYRAEFYSDPEQVEPNFVDKVKELENRLQMQVLLLWHGITDNKFSFLDDLNYLAFAHNIRKLKEQESVAVIVFSPGGTAGAAFKLASLLRKHCGGFVAIVPYYAKSAATLFTLGADKIIMSKFAELGPLDVQIRDIEKEKYISGLEVAQAIERLNSEAMRAVDQQMLFWLGRTGKKVETLLPLATHFVAEMMQPLFDKIDTVYFTGVARNLKVAQDYAQRLLENRGLNARKAESIADK
jgi:ClpP class serine protease